MRDLDLDAALELLDARVSTARTFGDVPVRQYSGAELVTMAQAAGFRLLAHYGILCICGQIFDNDIKYQPGFFEKLERLEIAMSTRDPYRAIAKFAHLIFRAP